MVASDPFVEANAYFEWLSGIGMGLTNDTSLPMNSNAAVRRKQKSNTDISMPDYISSDQTPSLVGTEQECFAAEGNGEGDSTHMKVPTNTPTTCDLDITEIEGTFSCKLLASS